MTRQYAFRSVVLLGLAMGAAVSLGCGNRNSDDDFNPVGQLAVETGQGPVSYVAPQDGTIYVYGGKDNNLVYSGPIKKGETLSVEPKEKRLMIDGRVISSSLDTGNRTRIYLDSREEMSASGGTTSVRTSTGNAPDRVIVEHGPRSTEYRPTDAQSR
jgi:hypothetical protein